MGASDLRLTINQLLRYGYGGAIVFIMGYILFPCETVKIIKLLGQVGTPLFAFMIGAVIYSVYRPIGDSLVFNIEGCFHRKINKKREQNNKSIKFPKFTCKRYLLEKEYGIDRRYSLDAVRVVRDEIFLEERQRPYYLQHTEIHLLYITFFILFIGAIIQIVDCLFFSGYGLAVVFFLFLGAFLFLIFAVWLDVLVCRQECFYLYSLHKQKYYKKVENALKNAGLI